MIVVDASAAITALLNAGPARQVLAEEQVHVPISSTPRSPTLFAAESLPRGSSLTMRGPRWTGGADLAYPATASSISWSVFGSSGRTSRPMTPRTSLWPNRWTVHCSLRMSGLAEPPDSAVR